MVALVIVVVGRKIIILISDFQQAQVKRFGMPILCA